MLNIGFGEMLILAAIALIVLGPKELPKMARMLGKTIGELKKAIREVTSTMTADVTEDWKKPPREAKKIKPPEELPEKTVARNSTDEEKKGG